MATIDIDELQRLLDQFRLEQNGREPSVSDLLDMARREERSYVRVRFASGGQMYAYHCPNAQVGDYVVTPPNSYCRTTPQLRPVLALGRGDYRRECRPAFLVPRDFLRGTDMGSSGR